MRTFLVTLVLGVMFLTTSLSSHGATRLPSIAFSDPTKSNSADYRQHNSLLRQLQGKFNVLPPGTHPDTADYWGMVYPLEFQEGGQGGGSGGALPIPYQQDGQRQIFWLPVDFHRGQIWRAVRAPINIYKNNGRRQQPTLVYVTPSDFPGRQPVQWDRYRQVGSFYQYGWGFSSLSVAEAVNQAVKASLVGLPPIPLVTIEESVPTRPIIVPSVLSPQPPTTAPRPQPRTITTPQVERISAHKVRIRVPAGQRGRLRLTVRMADPRNPRRTLRADWTPTVWTSEGDTDVTLVAHPGTAFPHPLPVTIIWNGKVWGTFQIRP